MLPETYRKQDTSDKQLKRYLALIGNQMSYLHGRADTMDTLLDPYKCPIEYLPYLANMVGVEFIPGLREDCMRRLIAYAVALYKLKGTLMGLSMYCMVLTGWTAVATEKYHGINTGTSPHTWDEVAYGAHVQWWCNYMGGIPFPNNLGSQSINYWRRICIFLYPDISSFMPTTAGESDALIQQKVTILNKSIKTQVRAGASWEFVIIRA